MIRFLNVFIRNVISISFNFTVCIVLITVKGTILFLLPCRLTNDYLYEDNRGSTCSVRKLIKKFKQIVYVSWGRELILQLSVSIYVRSEILFFLIPMISFVFQL